MEELKNAKSLPDSQNETTTAASFNQSQNPFSQEPCYPENTGFFHLPFGMFEISIFTPPSSNLTTTTKTLTDRQ